MTSKQLAIHPKTTSLELIKRAITTDPRLPSKHTQRQYLADLAAFEAFRGGMPLTKSLAEAYAAKLQGQGKAPATINQKLAAIRWYARKLSDLAFDQDNKNAQEIAQKAARVATVQDVKGERLQRGRHLAAGELAAILKACELDPTPAGRRDAALFALAWACGLRREELAGLTLADLKPTGETEGDLIIRGKGNKTRSAYLYNGAYLALADWLATRGKAAGPLFVTITKAGTITHAKLSGEALRKILNKRSSQAGTEALTWHDYRRTFAGNLLDAGSDLATVQKLMGHSSPTTTSSYDRRPESTRRQAVKSLFVPYKVRKA